MRTQEEIDKEYAELCTRYGDCKQKIIHLEEQEEAAHEAIKLQREQFEEAFGKARLPLRRELEQIEKRWKELQVEIQSTVSQGNP